MKSYEDKVKILYGILSKGYDLMDVLLFRKGRPNPRKGLAERLPDRPLEILDVCCGTGYSTVAIAGKNSDYAVTGIDITGNMLKVARRKAGKAQLMNASFRETNAAKMDYAGEIFDIATISLALHEMPPELMERVLMEIGRVLKPGGRLFIIEWAKPEKGMKKLLFSIFPTLFEPKGFRDFLEIDWRGLLMKFGLQYEDSDHYPFTKLIAAVKQN